MGRPQEHPERALKDLRKQASGPIAAGPEDRATLVSRKFFSVTFLTVSPRSSLEGIRRSDSSEEFLPPAV